MQIAVIQFQRASFELTGYDRAVLSRVAHIQRRDGGTIRIVAHASQDATGERANYDVSYRRAVAVADTLMSLGVPRSAIVAEAASDNEPAYATTSARGVAANRRADIFLDL